MLKPGVLAFAKQRREEACDSSKQEVSTQLTMKEINKYEAISAGEAGIYTQEDLEDQFQCRGIFKAGELTLSWWEVDRAIFGGAMPGKSKLELPAPDLLRAEHFCDRRELGIINIGGTWTACMWVVAARKLSFNRKIPESRQNSTI